MGSDGCAKCDLRGGSPRVGVNGGLRSRGGIDGAAEAIVLVEAWLDDLFNVRVRNGCEEKASRQDSQRQRQISDVKVYVQNAPVESGVFGTESSDGRRMVGTYACCSRMGDNGLFGNAEATLLVSE